MARLWNDTVQAHRRDVRAAILDSTWALVAEHGAAAVTMSQVATVTGIGRATLYKYFPDIAAILAAWHERRIGAHLAELSEIAEAVPDPEARLRAVLTALAAHHAHRHRHQPSLGAELLGELHSSGEAGRAAERLHAVLTDIVRDAALAGEIRSAPPPAALARYCLAATSAATGETAEAVVDLTLDALACHRGDAEAPVPPPDSRPGCPGTGAPDSP